ncbi:MAG: aminotransferase class III-fold pyridoxal phosphate-dependent enzyme [Candidatus Hydrogenedentes bacterium]|nr:aminotransferase class III-fold pyridoxal phosphate-dependent enzyme [Candidatus Hydrogenedentota bacterium]
MRSQKTRFVPVRLSLKDIAGGGYVDALVEAHAALRFDAGLPAGSLARKMFRQQVAQRVDFFPWGFQQRLLELLPAVGTSIARPLIKSAAGASTIGFNAATKTHQAPLSGLGYFRVAENGVLYFTAKSEHYHAPLGHYFPGYDLIKIARNLGVPNATHNNTRGHLTRLLEEALVRAAAGLGEDDARYARLLSAKSPATPNRVLNLETGSLAAEAALKMVLARFYKPQPDSIAPKYTGRVPVIIVIGDVDGGFNANYHGTTMLTQFMRGMWNELREGMEREQLYVIRRVSPNDRAGLDSIFSEYDTGKHKIAAVFHEIVLMNYAGKLLDKKFVRHLYRLAKKHDVPVVVDEIQTGIWSPELFMFREYGVKPTFIAIGKGFPGGEYCASRILFSSEYDNLPQFGALVTNGQEELASLAYLVTMRWAQANAEVTSAVGEYYESRLRELAARHKDKVAAIEGRRHLAGVYFHELPPARAFAETLNRCGFDISVQTYKAGCPPSALTKLPLIAGYEAVDLLLECMGDALG